MGTGLAEKLIKCLESEEWHLYENRHEAKAELADKMGITTAVLEDLFQSEFGMKFKEWIEARRIEQARRALSDPHQLNRTITEISFDCGFMVQYVFNKSFKEQLGMTPSEYRARYACFKHFTGYYPEEYPVVV